MDTQENTIFGYEQFKIGRILTDIYALHTSYASVSFNIMYMS